jgi:hypothetical protein
MEIIRIVFLALAATFTSLASAAGLLESIPIYHRGALAAAAAFGISLTLHGSWISLLQQRQPRWLSAGLCWGASAALANTGIQAHHIHISAYVVEVVLAAVALSGGPVHTIASHLADWRESRAEIARQLKMSEGLLPWLAKCSEQVWRGQPESPIAAAHLWVRAALSQAVHRAECQIAEKVDHEEFRQLALTALDGTAHFATIAFAQAAIDCEQRALSAAAELREAVQCLPLPPSERERLAEECEAQLLSLILPR